MNKFIEYNNINLNKEDNLNNIMLDLTVFDPYQHIIPYKSNKTTTKSETNTPTIKDSISEIDYKPSNLVFDPKYGFMKKFIDIANQEGLKFNITSAYRPNSKTKNGSDSWHSKGYAIDIVPLSGMSWSDLKTKLSQSPNTLRFMRENGLGIIDETTPEMLAKTGGTGAHWHIGKDKLAIDTFNRWFPQLKKGGIIKSQWGNKITGEYKVQPGDNLTKISNNLDIPVDSLLAFNNIPDKKKDDLKINQSIKWRKEPTFLDNISRFLFDSDEEVKKSNDLNKKIDNNVFNWKSLTITPKENPIYSTKFKEKDFKQFADTMKSIYSEVLDELNLPKHNINNLIRQDALESNYGLNTRGNGYNLGGIKVFNNKEKLGTKYSDGFYYRNFKDLKDYARYKVKLLHNDYGAITINSDKFIDALHGKNPKKKVYSARKDHYQKTFKDMMSLNKYLK